MRVAVRGVELGCDDGGGSGVPLVLVHGFPLDRTVWSDTARLLAPAFRVIAPDLRGFGSSAGAAGASSIDEHAADVCALLDALGIRRAVIGGVSMGGYVAMAFQRRFANRARGYLFVDTKAGADSPEARAARDRAIGLARAEGVGAVAAEMLPKMLAPSAPAALRDKVAAVMTRQRLVGVVAALAALRDRPASEESNATIRVPTLVVHGADDALIPPSEGEALAKGVPGARLELVAGAGHLPNFERPAEFAAAVTRGLAASLGG